ncbi:MAG: hypothetical protein JW801_13830 [Bacteroidales bacterium]|nr:hypothetical protein [Bacteroidales bacterium]
MISGMMTKTLSLLVLITAFQTVHAVDNIMSLAPDTTLYEGLTTYKAPAVYPYDDLYILINGGADVYYEYGFSQVLNAAYLTGSGDRIEVYIYEMTDVPAAFGIFSHTRMAGFEVSSDKDHMQLTKTDLYVLLQKDKYFVTLSWSTPSDGNSALADRIARAISDGIDNPEPLPDLITRYTQQGFKLGDVKYIRGTIALSSAFFFSHKNIFNIREAVYLDEKEQSRIDFYYEDTVMAEAQLKIVKEEISSSSRTVDYVAGNNFLTYTDKRGRKIKISQTGSQIQAIIVKATMEGGTVVLPEGL